MGPSVYIVCTRVFNKRPGCLVSGHVQTFIVGGTNTHVFCLFETFGACMYSSTGCLRVRIRVRKSLCYFARLFIACLSPLPPNGLGILIACWNSGLWGNHIRSDEVGRSGAGYSENQDGKCEAPKLILTKINTVVFFSTCTSLS